jgi:uncharacterized HhH-GPD family protein
MSRVAIPITGDDTADRLLEAEPLALVLGMLLDQQVPMEWAFRGPLTLRDRLGRQLDAAAIAALPQNEFVALCAAKPAVHRFPASMGRRMHELCGVIATEYDNDAARIWTTATNAAELAERLRDLPGFGAEKTKILIAILAKRLGIRPDGWEQVAAPFSDDQPRSVADVGDAESLARVRDWKKMMKAANKSKQDSPAP